MAQVTALRVVFNALSEGTISILVGTAIGVYPILAYTLFGGKSSVATTDFIQIIIVIVGLAILAIFAGEQAGAVAGH